MSTPTMNTPTMNTPTMNTPKTETEQFEHHAARAFFASAWADACEEAGSGDILSGQKIMNIMPVTIDPAATHAARILRMDIERVNGQTIPQLLAFVASAAAGDRAPTAEFFGHYAAMRAMGHGVGLRDAFGAEVDAAISVPSVEFGSHSLQRDYFVL
jgi:hypothetical protein